MAKFLDGQAPGGDRTPLSQLAPLSTPLVVQIFPAYACNFSCKYCTMSIPPGQRDFISDKRLMDFDLFTKCIHDMTTFDKRIITLRFVGMGEPLLHHRLPDMIEFAKIQNVAERLELITNGSLLYEMKAKSIIDAGLDRLVISIQGTTAKKYQEVSNFNINMHGFVQNLQTVYKNRGNMRIHIKIVDCALDDAEDKRLFLELFGNCCDTIAIERVGPIHPGVEYNETLKQDQNVNQYGEALSSSDVCSQPFYMMQINPDGNVVPCFAVPYPIILGNCREESVVDIWNGKAYNKFRYDMLNGYTEIDNNICNECMIFKHRTHASDDLHTKREELRKYYVEA